MVTGACLSAQAQWLNQPTPGAPRTPDGKVDMTGPVPHVDGKPDLSGIWQVEVPPGGPPPGGLGESPSSKYFFNVLADFRGGDEPLTPEGAEMLRRNTQPEVIGPNLRCLPEGVPRADLMPEPFKIIQTPREVLILYEVHTIFRQIFSDGRKLPDDPSPTWLGYSVGRWDGDTFVVDTMGFNNLSWLDGRGHGHSEQMRVEERFHRRDFGHLDMTVTITDPKTFTKAITINFVEQLLPDTDVFEHICNENEKDAAHQPGKTPYDNGVYVDAAVLSKYVGMYEVTLPNGQMATVNVKLDSDELSIAVPGVASGPLVAESSTLFLFRGRAPFSQVQFVSNEQGEVTHLVFISIGGERKAPRTGPPR